MINSAERADYITYNFTYIHKTMAQSNKESSPIQQDIQASIDSYFNQSSKKQNNQRQQSPENLKQNHIESHIFQDSSSILNQSQILKQQLAQPQKLQKREQQIQSSQNKKFQIQTKQHAQTEHSKGLDTINQTPFSEKGPNDIEISSQSRNTYPSQSIFPTNFESTRSNTQQILYGYNILENVFRPEQQTSKNSISGMNKNLQSDQISQNQLGQLGKLLENYSQNQISFYQQSTNNNLIPDEPGDSLNFRFHKIGNVLVPKQEMIHNPTSIIIALENNLKDLKKQDKNSPKVIICLSMLGRIYKMIHSYDKANQYLLESLKRCELIMNFTQQFENYALFILKKIILGDLAEVQFELKNSQQAMRYSNQAYKFADMFNDKEMMLKVKVKSSFIYRYLLYEYKNSNQTLEEAILFCKQNFKNWQSNEVYIRIIVKLSQDYLEDGQYKKSLQLSIQASQIYANSLLDSWMQPIIYQFSAIAFLALGQYQKAKEKIEESINLCRHSNNESMIISGKHYLGQIYQKMGDLNKAQLLYSQSLNFFMQQPQSYGQKIGIILRNLGTLKISLNQSDQFSVLSCFNRALQNFDTKGEEKCFIEIIITVNERANAYVRFQRYDQAQKDFKKAFKMLESRNITQFTHAAKLYYDWASFLYLKKIYHDALNKVERALKIWETKFQPAHYQIRNAKDLKHKIMQNMSRQSVSNKKQSFKSTSALLQIQQLKLQNSISRSKIQQKTQFTGQKSKQEQNVKLKQFSSQIISSGSIKSIKTSNKTKKEQKSKQNEKDQKQTPKKDEKSKQSTGKSQVISIKSHFYIPDVLAPNSQIYYQTQIVGHKGKIIQKNLKAPEVLQKGGEMLLIQYFEKITREKDKAKIQEEFTQSDKQSEYSLNQVSIQNQDAKEAEEQQENSNRQGQKSFGEVNKQCIAKGVELNKTANNLVKNKNYQRAEEKYFQSMEIFTSNDLFQVIEYGKLLFDMSQFELIRGNQEQALDLAENSLEVLKKSIELEHPAVSQVVSFIITIKNQINKSVNIERQQSDQESKYITEGESLDVMYEYQ